MMKRLAHWGLLLWVICVSGLLACLSACISQDTPTPETRWPTLTALIAANRSGKAISVTATIPAVAQIPLSRTPEPTDVTTEIAHTDPAISTEQPQPTPTPVYTLWLSPALPSGLSAAIQLPSGLNVVEQAEIATGRIEISAGPALENSSSRWVYALVAPFPTISDGVSSDVLRSAWAGAAPAIFPGPIWMDAETERAFTVLWGSPAPQAVQIAPTARLLESAWGARPAWAIIPFEQIEPRWKVLTVDGQSPLHKEFDPAAYPLTLSVAIYGEAPVGVALPPTNRDPDRLTSVAMTGVTALVRATAWLMEKNGVLYPAQEIRDWLRAADITHISNDIAFDPDCPRPDPSQSQLVFCSDPKYIALLEDVGADVIELTGDHFIDRSPEAMLLTIDMYRERGWLYYGGGENLDEALNPVQFEHNGNRIAFIGCNAKGGGYTGATDRAPGAAECDFDRLHATVKQLAEQGILVIATMQHQEYFRYQVLPDYRPDFTGFVDAGAVVVQGSQAHQPQNFEFYQGGLIHYGLGNLFFDQIKEVDSAGDHIASRAFIDRHYFYAGRYLGAELLTIQFVDLARSRPMTVEERSQFLQVIFKASDW